MTSLLHASEMFEEQRAFEVTEEEAREAREAVKAEQDAAYLESLKADRAKVRKLNTVCIVYSRSSHHPSSIL